MHMIWGVQASWHSLQLLLIGNDLCYAMLPIGVGERGVKYQHDGTSVMMQHYVRDLRVPNADIGVVLGPHYEPTLSNLSW